MRYLAYIDTRLISIHALPAEGDYAQSNAINSLGIFQSTPSPRRATSI